MKRSATTRSHSTHAGDPAPDPPPPPAGEGQAGVSGRNAPSSTFRELARLFADRQDVKFWETEGPRYNYLFWVRAMLSEQAEPPPRIDRPVARPQSEADYLRFARARREAYSFLARAFEYPIDVFLTDIANPAYVEAVAAAFRHLAENDDVRQGLALWRQTAGDDDALIGSGRDVPAERPYHPMRQAYTRLIYDTQLPFIPPYESVYCGERQVMGKRAGSAAELYRQAGLGVEGNEMPDHIALECEFVARLAEREMNAWQAGRREEAQQIWVTTSRFLSEHVLSWGGKFCADLLALARVDFYRAVARLGAGLFNDELVRLVE